MNNTKHTPGPWTVENVGFQAGVITAPGRTLGIAEVFGAGDIDKANARLIAAAPELLEALHTMLTCADALGAMQGEPTPEEDALLDSRKAARAAIAKATGQE